MLTMAGKAFYLYVVSQNVGSGEVFDERFPPTNSIGAELDLPFDDAAAGFLIAENVTERVLRDYRYVVGIKVVAELLGCDKDGVQ